MINSATNAITIQKLRSVFATHGLPRVVVSENVSVFTRSEFQDKECMASRTAPYTTQLSIVWWRGQFRPLKKN